MPVPYISMYYAYKHMALQAHYCLFFQGHKGQLAPHCRALEAMIKNLYHGIQKVVHQFRFKNIKQHLLLGSGGNHSLRLTCRRPPTRTFRPPPP